MLILESQGGPCAGFWVTDRVSCQGRKLMKSRTLFCICTFIMFGLFGIVGLQADEVTNWNLVATGAAFAAGQSPPVQTRTYAIVHVAIHDALNAIDRRYGPYAL